MTPAGTARVDVACAGILVADCVARPVLRQPAPGRLELVDFIGLHPGGSAANTGYGLARLGLGVALVGRVGRDGLGDFLVAEAERHGCDAGLIRRDDSAATSATLVTVDADGERAFLHSVGANARLVPEDVPLESLRERGARTLHLAGLLVLPGLDGNDGAPAAALFARATELGLITSLDCVWDATGRWERARGVLPFADLFCPSLAEAQAITGREEPAAVASTLIELGVRRAVALKMGPDGSFVMARTGEAHRVPAAHVETVDGTGAGDAFVAGFLAGWLRDLSLLECARLGNAAGARCVTALGATAGLAGWDETEALARTIPAGAS